MTSLLAVLFSAVLAPGAYGTLKGHVDIGPLTPVERVGETPHVPPAMYKEYQIRIFAASVPAVEKRVEKALKTLAIDAHGDFNSKLPPGEYKVAVASTKPTSMLRRLPDTTIKVTADKTTKVQLKIDTGIR